MNWYYYLNYSIYKFYQNKKESMPALFSFLGTILFVFMNVFSILSIVDLYQPFLIAGNKYYVLLFMVILAIFNYFCLYKKKKHIIIFNEFDGFKDKFRNWNKYVLIYIISSVLFMLITLGIENYRYNGHL